MPAINAVVQITKLHYVHDCRGGLCHVTHPGKNKELFFEVKFYILRIIYVYGSHNFLINVSLLLLLQVYQVAYVIIKSAISPRPGSWILERSLDGETFTPWQYFGTSDKDCLERYGVQAKKGKPHYSSDTEVICTAFYSKLMPIENGEVSILQF